MKKAVLLLGPSLVLILSAAPQRASAQAAAEYGLTSAASATSTSGLAKIYSQKLNGHTASRKIHQPGAMAATHTTPPVGSKVRVRNKKTGRSTVATVASRPQQIDVSPAVASGFRVYGSETPAPQ